MFKNLLGKTLVRIDGLHKGSEYVTFVCSDGDEFNMYHSQDCCESVSIEDVCGDVNDLLNSPIVRADEESSGEDIETLGGKRPPAPTPYDDSFTWTFYRLGTQNGTVVIRWYGSSNGYYGETPYFEKVTK